VDAFFAIIEMTTFFPSALGGTIVSALDVDEDIERVPSATTSIALNRNKDLLLERILSTER